MSAARETIVKLLDKRGPGKTICPSDAAKQLSGHDQNWRMEMENVHAAVDQLLIEGAIVLSWKGERKEQRRGPYRIARR